MRKSLTVLSIAVTVPLMMSCEQQRPGRPEVVYPYRGGLGVCCPAPAGTEVRYVIDWGDGRVDTTAPGAVAGDTVVVPIACAPEDSGYARVRVKAFRADAPEAESDWSGPIRVSLLAGQVLWWWVHDFMGNDEGRPETAPVLAMHDGRELVYVGADDEAGRVFSVDAATGHEVAAGNVVEPLEGYEFSGHIAFNPSTGHVISAKDDGEFYVHPAGLGPWVWHWPNASPLTEFRWDSPAVAGNRVFAFRADTMLWGRLYRLEDGQNPPVDPSYLTLTGDNCARRPPVVDADGYVIFATDSGYVYKIDQDFEVQWRFFLGPWVQVTGLALGFGNICYIATENGGLCAVNPDGTARWYYQTSAADCYPVVGDSHVYLATDRGNMYCFDLSGNLVWEQQVSSGGLLVTYPVLSENGMLFVQDHDDYLYHLRRSDGEVIWRTVCPDPYRTEGTPGRLAAGRDVHDPPPAPTITSSGNIILVGWHAMFCVKGWPGTRLDPYAPWPKWQRDVYNRGCLQAE